MIKTAIILAGGFGTRLQSVVNDVPKPMAPINNVPFLSYQLNYLKYYGINTVILSTGYLSEKISSFYGNEYNGLQIIYSHEETPLGTGGAIKLALNHFNNDLVLVINGDSFFDININTFYLKHINSKAHLSLALKQTTNTSRYGTVETFSDNRIYLFKEKTGQATAGFINAGVYILNRHLYMGNTPTKMPFSIEKDFFEKQLNKIIIKGFNMDGYFIDIGIPEDFEKAQHDFKTFKY
jgi:D-glycero-alpha-D-manno-heptose 1-phosphate guanylyltransferase